MAESVAVKKTILLMDYYDSEGKKLYASIRQSGLDWDAAVIEEDGFLPEGLQSVYGFFLGDFAASDNNPGKPLYFNQIKVPEYWEISGTNTVGKVQNLDKERAQIYYAEPKHKRLVKAVDWLDENGLVRSSDHYNRFGALYARTVFSAKGEKVCKSFFSVDNKEIITENYVTRDIILRDGDRDIIFRNKSEFVKYFILKSGHEQSRIFFNSLSTPFFVSENMEALHHEDVLFWQEPKRPDIPGNMQIILNRNATRTSRIFVQRKSAYKALIDLGVNPDVVKPLGFVYPFKGTVTNRPTALICTNSDQLEQLQALVEGLPEMHFYIAAITEMSQKLLGFGNYPNVTTYPGVKLSVVEELFEKCDYYLDINHYNEILDAIPTAFENNQLIFAFKETLHNVDYVAERQIYSSEDVAMMIADIKATLDDMTLYENRIEAQYEAAMVEEASKYLEL